MTTEQHLTDSLPLTAGTTFADSLYDSMILLKYIPATETLEQTSASALAEGDIETALRMAEAITLLNREVFSLSFEA